MFFASDNAGPVHPRVLDAMSRANDGYALGYGADDLTERAVSMVREVFEAPDASVHLVTLGTAANALALATMVRPWDAVFCHPLAHISEDECNAPEFYSGGAKLVHVDGPDAKMTPEALRHALTAAGQSVHGAQRGPVSLTQVTELGTIYTLDELRALTDIAKSMDVRVHMDGARFANAQVALGCTASEMTWKAGIDVVSFGGTKNGLMAAEAVVFFDPQHAWEFELRRKRAAHLISKHRFLAAQMVAYLEDDLWLDMARSANGAMARLADGLRATADVGLLHEPQANMAFVEWPEETARRLKEAGAMFYPSLGPTGRERARLVCDWSIGTDQIDQFLGLVRG